MAPKIDFLYPFDKGFFGKTLKAGKSSGTLKEAASPRVVSDSISDFLKHFEGKMKKSFLERTPVEDNFVRTDSIPDIFPDMIP